MANPIGLKLSGGPEMLATLREAGDFLSVAVSRNAVRRGMVHAAEPMAAAMKAAAPKDVKVNTGRGIGTLADAIGVFTKLSARQRKDIGKATLNVKSGTSRTNNAVVIYVGVGQGKPTLIGVWQEFGTDERITESGKSTGHITPHPFVRPAFEAGQQAWLNAIAKPVGEELEKACNRARKKRARSNVKDLVK